MKLSTALGALMTIGLLTACDAVRVPGVDTSERDAPASQPAPVDTVQTPPPAETPSARDPAPAVPEPVAEPVTDLAQINAITCGLQRTEEETLTVAQQHSQQLGPQPEGLLQTAAVGGLAARLAAYPGIVKMEPRRIEGTSVSSGHCGATRISERWFVTAAHCVDEGYDEIRFVTGVENVQDTESASIVTAEIAICHSAFERSGVLPNDVALLRMPEDAVPQLTTIPVANYGATQHTLSSFNYPSAEMAGWGVTRYNALPSPILLSAPLDVVSSGAGHITIASVNGSGPCVGDSGGPLYVREEDGKMVVIGVLSHVMPNDQGQVCVGEYQGRYTNLQSYLGWMDSVMAACDSDTTLCL